MKCVYCGNENNLKMKLAHAEGGLVRLPVCNVDEMLVDETFARPLTMKQLIGMQKEMIK